MILVNRKLLKLAELAPKGELRYTPNAIAITQQETVVTDGHLLARVTHPKADASQFPLPQGFEAGNGFETILLKREDALNIAKVTPTKETMPILNHAAVSVTSDADGAHLKVAVNDLNNPQVFSPRLVVGRFPRWQGVIPTGPAEHVEYVSPELLLAAAKQAVEFTRGQSQPSMRLMFGKRDSAIRMDVECDDTQQGLTMILMPMQSAGKYDLCWPTPKPAEDSAASSGEASQPER